MGSVFDENSEFLKYLREKKEGTPKLVPEILKAEEQKPTEIHIEAKQTDAYTLNLKHVKLSEPNETPAKRDNHPKSEPIAKKTAPTKKEKKLKKLEQLQERPAAGENLIAFIWDKIKFLGTATAIFIVAYLALNWSAYSQIFSIWYDDVRGIEQDSALTVFAETPRLKNTDVVSGSLFAQNNFSIPKIDIEVTPPGTRIIIPRVNQNVPVVNVSDDKLLNRDWAGLEQDLQAALRDGVVHYPGTSWFDQSGNVVITGHSSYYPWDPGRFKDVFALLHQVVVGDEIVVFHKQQKYKYVVSEIKVVLPTEVNVLGDSGDNRLTLITCTPIGTNLKRLIVIAKPVEI